MFEPHAAPTRNVKNDLLSGTWLLLANPPLDWVFVLFTPIHLSTNLRCSFHQLPLYILPLLWRHTAQPFPEPILADFLACSLGFG